MFKNAKRHIFYSPWGRFLKKRLFSGHLISSSGDMGRPAISSDVHASLFLEGSFKIKSIRCQAV